jgi:hypothetical protein
VSTTERATVAVGATRAERVVADDAGVRGDGPATCASSITDRSTMSAGRDAIARDRCAIGTSDVIVGSSSGASCGVVAGRSSS